VVTLGFGVKTYLSYRMRLRRQREVQKENEYYFEFLREALPPGQVRDEAFNPQPSPKTCKSNHEPSQDVSSIIMSFAGADDARTASDGSTVISSGGTAANHHGLQHSSHHSSSAWPGSNSSSAAAAAGVANGDAGAGLSSSDHHNGHGEGGGGSRSPRSGHHKLLNGGAHGAGVDDADGGGEDDAASNVSGKGGGKKQSASLATAATIGLKGGKNRPPLSKEEQLGKLESDLRRMKADLQQSKNKENDLREQIISYMSGERHLKSEISNLQVEKSLLESRVAGLMSTRAGEKAALSTLEKKLAEERRQKTDFQVKLETERKSKKEAASAERNAHAAQTRSEVLKLEAEIKTLRAELGVARERASGAESEAYALRKYKETHGDPEVLVTALKSMQEKNGNIEKALSAETKLKMDLFSALGEARRELSIKQGEKRVLCCTLLVELRRRVRVKESERWS